MMMGKCYKVVHEKKSMMGAEVQCRKEGATLAKPTTLTHVRKAILVSLLYNHIAFFLNEIGALFG